MRIKRLDLIKYGKFSAESLSFPEATHDFHVIVGPNEAGKSTIRNAVLELLFGMPNQTGLAFLHELPELRLGAILESDGQKTVFHRARGRTQLRTPADEKLPNDHLAPLLGGATKEFFEQMFGLDHQRLVEGGRSILDASKDLGRVLFQSAAGIGSLGPVREALETRATELWTRRGSGNEYAQANARFNEASAEFKAAHVRTRVWSEARTALDEITETIDTVQARRLQLETLRSKLERVRRLAPFLRELTAKETELAELGAVVQMPPTAYADLVKGQADLASARRLLQERHKDVETCQHERTAITIDEQVLRYANELEVLEADRGACANHLRDLPLRQAEVHHLHQEALVAANALGWPADVQALRQKLPSTLALKTIATLHREHGALRQSMAGAQQASREKERDLQGLRLQLESLPTASVPDTLRLALADAQAFKNSHAKQQALKASLEEAEHQLANALTALGRWNFPTEVLRAMGLPSQNRVLALQRLEQEHASALASAREKLAEAQALAEQLQLREQQFTASNKVVTPAEVLEARAKRDDTWSQVKAGAVTLATGAPLVDAAIRLADELADSQLGNATEAATLQSIREQIQSAHADTQRKLTAMQQREDELSRFQADWGALSAAAGIPDMALADLPDWLLQRDHVFTIDAALRQHRRDLLAEKQAGELAAATLASALAAVSTTAVDAHDIGALAATAAAFVQRADSAHIQREGLERQIAQAEEALTTLHDRHTHATDAHQAWQRQWQQALQAAGLSGAAATLAQAEGAVELVNTIAEKLESADSIQRTRILAMQEDLAALKTNARRLAGVLNPQLLELGDWPEVARRLMARLRKARDTAQEARAADEALRKALARKDEAQLHVAQAEARLLPLLKLANVGTPEQALPIAARSDQQRELLAVIDKAKTVCIRDGDGLARDAIEAEIAEYHPTEIVGHLERTKRELDDVNGQLAELLQRQVTTRQAYDAINGHANAATAQAKRQEALASMGEIAEQYLEAATASRLLKWAIDRYRDQKQGPMLQRAGEIFAQLTLGQFTRLSIDHEVSPPALFARREGGRHVDVSGLSEGTRDQLFLALRIAALELHLQHTKALPFIADDLFVNFDDARAKAGLEALRELSTHTQVLFLTHHTHLLAHVRDVFSTAVNIVELENTWVAAP